LARFYGIDSGRVTLVDAGAAIDIPTGHRVEVVPGTFCPTRGAIMLHDPAAHVLFSGALFGGAKQSRDLVAGEASWAGVRLLHETLMPSRKALRLAVHRVRRLTPPPLAIAPQHGGAVVGVDVKRLLERVERLRVGLDLLE
jgi:flavorubredoxin